MQNGFCESFNGRTRDELRNESLFFGLDDARTKIAVSSKDTSSPAKYRDPDHVLTSRLEQPPLG